jgi:phage virion morphogenesis protein
VSAGISIQVSGLDQVQQVLSNLEQVTMSEFLEGAAEIIVNQTKERIDTIKKAPDGTAWAEHSKGYKKRLEKMGKTPKLLQLEGFLLTSITSEVNGNTIEVGSNKIYAATHQFGAKKGEFGSVSRNVAAHERVIKNKTQSVKAHTINQSLPWGDIPARPFLGLSQDDIAEIETAALDFVQAQMDGA